MPFERTEPHCGKCGLAMTRANARLRPELFLHDDCLPDELKPPGPGDCGHQRFACNVAVNRMEDTGRFHADVTIQCQDCGTPMRFLGLPLGLDLNGASVSFDGAEARLAIAPKGETVPPITGVKGFSIRKRS